jgi:chemotaxis signal transduction protein
MDRDLVIFPLGEDRYALTTDRVRQVVVTPAVTSIPTAPPSILGVFNLRGEIVPLVDLSLLLGLPAATPRAGVTHAVVVETPSGPAGLAVTDMPRFGHLGPQMGASELPGTSGLYSVDDELAVLLDADILLSPTRVETS